MNPVTLTMVDGVKVVVPDSLDLITTYVLREQHDWFEDEIRFVRRLLQPGDRVVDIGANYGVYTLAMARLVGASGDIWAFEPTPGTAALLRAGIAANGYSQVHVLDCAVSHSRGVAHLVLHENAELNALRRDGQAAGPTIEVPLVSLDDCSRELGWRDIAFLKIDAEGEEANVLRGGHHFFAEQSPLVQFEVLDGQGERAAADLAGLLAAQGYRSYRLLPGLNLLVPFDPQAQNDAYLLNLFCCKADRAARLMERGLLVDSIAAIGELRTGQPQSLFRRLPALQQHHWRRTLAQLPYGKALASHWEGTVISGESDAVEEALALYGMAQDTTVAPTQRVALLHASLASLRDTVAREPAYLRLLSLARVARACGERFLAIQCLQQAAIGIFQEHRLDPTEPFLAPCARFDQIVPGEQLGNWVAAATLEELEQMRHFSSYFEGSAALENLRNIEQLGYAGEEMQRRLALVRQRAGT